MRSCRRVLDALELKKSANASLIMARYIKNLDDNSESRLELFDAMKQAARNAKDLYTHAFNKRHNFLSHIASSKCFETIEPLAAGLGSSNVLESGLALNPTYGIPIIAASSIKGVTAHYCSEVFGLTDERYKAPNYKSESENNKSAGSIYELLFGKIYPEDEQESGILRFYDAWLLPEYVNNAFIDDVMTPHHSDYYSSKQDIPSEFDDPVPVKFLTVRGRFEFWLSCEIQDSGWLEFAFKITEQALRNYGIGGKITTGFGKMKPVKSH